MTTIINQCRQHGYYQDLTIPQSKSCLHALLILIFNFFVGPRSILWGHWLPLFGTSCDGANRFSLLHSCLRAMNLSVTSGASPVFSTKRGVHCIRMYTAGSPSRCPSCQYRRAGRDTNPGHSLDKWACYPLSHAGRLSLHTLYHNCYKSVCIVESDSQKKST